MTLQELKKLKDKYRNAKAVFVTGVELASGAIRLYGFIEEYDDGYLVCQEGGRVDYILKSNISCIRVDTMLETFPSSTLYQAPGLG